MVGKLNLSDHRYNYPYKGFTSIFNQIIVLAKIHYNLYGNYNVFVEDYQILNLFDNMYIPHSGDTTYNVSDIFFEDFFAGKYENDYNAHKLVNIDDLKTRQISKFLKYKDEVLVEFLKIKENLFGLNKFIGVQIRGTDKNTELPSIKIDNVITHIDAAIEKYPTHKIFIATDDNTYLSIIRDKYGSKVVFNEGHMISYNGNPLHTNHVNRERVNREVMLDVYLLSCCDYILYSFSNVSFLALSIMENHKKEIININ